MNETTAGPARDADSRRGEFEVLTRCRPCGAAWWATLRSDAWTCPNCGAKTSD